MSGGTVAELLADLIEPAHLAWAVPTPAKAAKSANREHSCGLTADSGAANPLRISANPSPPQPEPAPDSQTFAADSQGANPPQSKQWRGVSQDSPNSQGCPPTSAVAQVLDLARVAWTDVDIERFQDRRARLLRWGWPAPQAEKLAERLVQRHRVHDVRVNCIECQHYRPGRCGNHKAAMLCKAEVGRDLASLLQHCPGHAAA